MSLKVEEIPAEALEEFDRNVDELRETFGPLMSLLGPRVICEPYVWGVKVGLLMAGVSENDIKEVTEKFVKMDEKMRGEEPDSNPSNEGAK